MKTILQLAQLLVLLLCIPTIPSTAQRPTYQKEAELIFTAFRDKNYTLLQPLLDEQVRIGTLPKGRNDVVVPQVLNQLPEPASFRITAIREDSGGTRVYTEYTYSSGSTRPQSFLFNQNGKITDMDVLQGTRSLTAGSTRPDNKRLPVRLNIPFTVQNGIIFVKATLNGREENFIFDSGCPSLLLNADFLQPSDLVGSGAVATGVGGSQTMQVYHIDSFSWNGIHIQDEHIITLSLKHLEKATGMRFAGLIGYALFKEYEITYDYPNRRLLLNLTDTAGNLIDPGATFNSASGKITTLPFELEKHIPVFPVQIGTGTYRVGLDCGASGNLLYQKYYKKMVAERHIKKAKTTALKGAGTTSSDILSAIVTSTRAGTLTLLPMRFAFDNTNLDQLNSGYGLRIDGLVGYELLRQQVTTVNYKKKQIRFYTP